MKHEFHANRTNYSSLGLCIRSNLNTPLGAIAILLTAAAIIFVAGLLACTRAQEPSKPTEPKVIGTVTCKRVATVPNAENVLPKSTTLDCGKDDKGQDAGIAIPETYATFPFGDVFTLELLDNGGSRFNPKNQPEGSVVRISPPCHKRTNNDYPRPALNEGPCNPELPPL